MPVQPRSAPPPASGAGRQKIIVVQGPTGVGKTAVAIRLARELSAEIINADSQQFYRYMDIGTSKPGPAELASVPHHLFSVIDPDQEYNAALFMREAGSAIAEIASRGSVPLIVGGTGLYVRALTRGLSAAPPADPELRRELKGLGRQELRRRLELADPEAASRICPNDEVRTVRALEVYELTGEPLSLHNSRHGFQDAPYDCLKLFLNRSRQELYRRIDDRVTAMIEAGLVREVQELFRLGFGPELRPLGSIGYRQIGDFLRGAIELSEAVRRIQRETRRLAKRQLTWLRHDGGNVLIDLPEQEPEALRLSKKFLNVG